MLMPNSVWLHIFSPLIWPFKCYLSDYLKHKKVLWLQIFMLNNYLFLNNRIVNRICTGILIFNASTR